MRKAMEQPSLFDLPITPLQELREQVREGRDDGCTCPVCDQFCKVYKRKLNSGMARSIIYCYQVYKLQPFNLESALRSLIASHPNVPRSGDPAKLRFWGFLERCEEEGGGVYRITPSGEKFIMNREPATKHVFIYNNEFLAYGDENTSIKDALGDHFNYAELMGSIDNAAATLL
jgi:hypothetical protein